MFVFKFEKLLKIKEDLIKQHMLEIANIDAVIKQKSKLKMELEKENSSRRKKIDVIIQEEPNKNMLLFLSDNIEKTELEIKHIINIIEALKNERKEIVEKLKVLNIEKKKLEKLKEKEYERYIKEESQKEMRFLDEIASIKAYSSRTDG